MLTSFDIYQKSGESNIVTTLDINAKNYLIQELKTLLPNGSFISKENDFYQTKEDYVWIIDPIDGTENYFRGIKECPICVALMHK